VDYAAYVLETARATYYLDENGAVIARTNGPRGWDYSGKWIIRGFLRRWNAGMIYATVQEAADGVDIGHGYVADLDHGTMRVWGNERATDVRVATDNDRTTAERLQRVAA
jgi:hypothetical protein